VENPRTWGEAESIVNDVIHAHDAHVHAVSTGQAEPVIGLSLARRVTDALRKANLLNDTDTGADLLLSPADTAEPDKWCETCGNPVGDTERCSCWCLLADALQRYLGVDFDGAAQMAADLWDSEADLWDSEADKEFVWSAKYADDHDVTTYPRPGTE
jgi:hypothetical protein